MTTQLQMDAAKSQQFAQKLLTDLNGAGLALMISIGHRTGLFDAMKGAGSLTSAALAGKSGMRERYVREWLGAMTVGGVVEYDAATEAYHLPDEHAAWLTREGVSNNVASTFQWVSVMAQVESEIVECFRKGGGVPYEKFHRFHEVMAEESHQTVVAPLLKHILPLAPDIITKLEQGGRAADIGCGSGLALIRLAEAYPKTEFVGFDLCEDAVRRGRDEIARKGLKNVQLKRLDFAAYEADRPFDVVFSFDAIHDQADPAKVLKNIHDAMQPDGIYLMQDIAGSSHVEKNLDHPIGTFVYTISCMHCMTVSLSQNGKGLGAMWGKETALQMLGEAGFGRVEVKTLEHDFLNNYYVVQK